MIPAPTVANLVAYTIQIAVIVFVGGAGIGLARLSAPRVRLACFRALLVACLALPFLQAPAGRQPAARPFAPASASALSAEGTVVGGSVDAAVTPGPATASASPTLPSFAGLKTRATVVVVIALGSAARLAWLAIGLLALGRLRKAARPIGPSGTERAATSDAAIARAADLVAARAEFLTSEDSPRPVTFGLRRPVVLLPTSFAALDETERVAIACHELLHVRRRDWLYTVGEELVRALFWFHPAVWWLLAQLDLSREQVIDHEVVALTAQRKPYLNALVRLATMPPGPILHPASLFLGRAHLLRRVALLSREVRMSRSRLALSVVVVAAVLVAGGRMVVKALPLTPIPAGASALLASPPSPGPSAPAMATGSSPHRLDAQQGEAASQATPSRPVPAKVVERVEPIVPATAGDPAADAIVIVKATVGVSGVLEGPGGIVAGDDKKLEAQAGDLASVYQMIDRFPATAPLELVARARAALDAARMWRFEPPAKPLPVTIGFNFARGTQSGPEAEGVRVGGAIRQPIKVRDVRPVYPAEAKASGRQGVVILEMTIDGAGIPTSALALRPVEGLTDAAMDAALRWRFEPRPETPRLLMTVTVNFVLGDGAPAGAAAAAPAGGLANATPRPLPSSWPSNALRVGDAVKTPTKIVDARPVYPAVAQATRVQGVVILEALIGTDGRVADARILRSIPLLDQAALDAVRQWVFTPTLLNGSPVPIVATLTVNFVLDDSPKQSSGVGAGIGSGAGPGVQGGVSGGVPGGVAGGVVSTAPRGVQGGAVGGISGGKEGGVAGGVVSGVPGGVAGGVASGVPGGVPGAVAAEVFRPGAGIQNPRPIREVRPAYTADAMRAKIEGSVALECVVQPDGSVTDVRVIKSLDSTYGLDEEAVKAAGQWRFLPGTRDGKPVPVLVTLELMFTLGPR